MFYKEYKKKDFVPAFQNAMQLDDSFKWVKNDLRATRKTGKVKLQIGFSYNQYNDFTVTKLVGGIKSFPEVEAIQKKFYEKHGKRFALFTIRHTYRFPENRDPQTDSRLSTIWRVSDDQDAIAIAEPLREALYEKLLPFLDRFQTIEQVYEYSETLEKKDMVAFFYPYLYVARLILKGILKTPDFEKFGNEVLKIMRDPDTHEGIRDYAPLIEDIYAHFLGEQ